MKVGDLVRFILERGDHRLVFEQREVFVLENKGEHNSSCDKDWEVMSR